MSSRNFAAVNWRSILKTNSTTIAALTRNDNVKPLWSQPLFPSQAQILKKKKCTCEPQLPLAALQLQLLWSLFFF
jgi:hypothetical protein